MEYKLLPELRVYFGQKKIVPKLNFLRAQGVKSELSYIDLYLYYSIGNDL
jgi:hypothetical protein